MKITVQLSAAEARALLDGLELVAKGSDNFENAASKLRLALRKMLAKSDD